MKKRNIYCVGVLDMCRQVLGKKSLHGKGDEDQFFAERGNIHEENLVLIFRCEPTDKAKATTKFSEDLCDLLTKTWERD